MKTTDIWFASFLKMNGFKLKDYVILSRGKGRYEFDITEIEWKNQKLKFVDSEISELKIIFDQLKDLLY